MMLFAQDGMDPSSWSHTATGLIVGIPSLITGITGAWLFAKKKFAEQALEYEQHKNANEKQRLLDVAEVKNKENTDRMLVEADRRDRDISAAKNRDDAFAERCYTLIKNQDAKIGELVEQHRQCLQESAIQSAEIAGLKDQLAKLMSARDAEIADLKGQVGRLQVEVSRLTHDGGVGRHRGPKPG